MWFWILFCLGFEISVFRHETKAPSSNVNIVNCKMVSRFLDSRKLYVVLDSMLPRFDISAFRDETKASSSNASNR